MATTPSTINDAKALNPGSKPHQNASRAILRGMLNRWTLSAVLTALFFALPIMVVVGSLFLPPSELWAHLADTVLSDYLLNTLGLVVGVSIGVLIIGVSTAYLISHYQFPGHRLFEWALLLPLAMPAYIIAYTWTGLLDFSGPVQALLRDLTGWGYGDYWFPPIRSLGGAIAMMTLVLYPYVYMLARVSFMEQPQSLFDAARSLGASPHERFWRIAMPMARPAIFTGLSLALMETLADYGTVQYFGLATFTTGIFRVWYGMDDGVAALQLSSLLLFIVFSVILLEAWSRRKVRFYQSAGSSKHRIRLKLSGKQATAASLVCGLPILLGFALPAIQLTVWSITTAEEGINSRFFTLTGNSLLLAAITAVLAILLAVFLSYSRRLHPTRTVRGSIRVASMGYAIPGTIIAVGVMIPFAWIDNTVDQWLRATFGISSGLLLSGTLVALIFAYLVRFLAVSVNAVNSGLGRINPTMDDAGRSLGLTPLGVVHRIHLPLMKGTLLSAGLLVFVDVLKELPATLILRPFNFNTLAVRAHEMAADERLADAGLPALMIVAVGILPVILLSRAISHGKK